MAQSLIAKLDAAYALDASPDAIVKHLSDPLRVFIKIGSISETLFEEIKDRDVAYYRYNGGGDAPCWNARATAQDVRKSWLRDRDYAEMHADRWLCRHWAIIGHEYRLAPDLVFPT
jgi:hypothetical protein